MVHKLAGRDERVLYIGSDPGAGTLRAMSKEFPRRHLIEGISEAHIIGMSAGLAMEGYVPYVNTIATFLTRRCYEQVAVDLCLHNLPVRLIANGGGLVYAPARSDPSGDRGYRDHAGAAEHDGGVPGRRRRGGAADGADARLAGADLHPAGQGRRCHRLQGGARLSDRPGHRHAAAGRRPDGDHRNHASRALAAADLLGGAGHSRRHPAYAHRQAAGYRHPAAGDPRHRGWL